MLVWGRDRGKVGWGGLTWPFCWMWGGGGVGGGDCGVEVKV